MAAPMPTMTARPGLAGAAVGVPSAPSHIAIRSPRTEAVGTKTVALPEAPSCTHCTGSGGTESDCTGAEEVVAGEAGRAGSGCAPAATAPNSLTRNRLLAGGRFDANGGTRNTNRTDDHPVQMRKQKLSTQLSQHQPTDQLRCAPTYPRDATPRQTGQRCGPCARS